MSNIRPLFFAFIVTFGEFCPPLYAHHSASLFDMSAPIILQGFIAEVRFANPHSPIFIDVEDAHGQRVRWAVENSGTLYATRQLRGLDGNKLQVGDPIEVSGFAPKQRYSTARELEARGAPLPAWWGDADKFITGRLLVLKDGPAEHWSHYGPLDICRSLLTAE